MEMMQTRDSIRKTTRIIQLDKILRGGEFVGIDDLILKFGVSQRTIERDFERLRDEMDAPLEYNKSLNKYHYSDPTFSIPNIVLTEGDLFTISTVLPLMEQYENTPLENSFRHIMHKITDMLPDTITVDSSFLNKDITFLKDSAPIIQEDVFNLIFQSIKSHRTLTFQHRSSKNQDYTNREFDAYHVLCQKGNWYVIGYEHTKSSIRLYSMARIRNICLTSNQFKIPEDFKLENHIDLDVGIWNNTNPPELYELLFAADMINYITERQWHKTQELEQQSDGTIILKFETNQKEMITSWVMSFGHKVTVLKPEWLREKIKDECIRMLESIEKHK